MQNDALIDGLVGDLRPVRRQGLPVQFAVLAGLGALELSVFLALGMMRPDMREALALPAFWWKLGGLALLAIIGVAVALRSFAPTATPRKGLRKLAVVASVVILTGWAVDAGGSGIQSLGGRLMWRMGLECVAVMIALSLPPAVALGWMMRRGASTDRRRSSLAVGIGAAASGAFIFAFHCQNDDPFYVGVWYSLGCLVIVALTLFTLPRWTRW